MEATTATFCAVENQRQFLLLGIQYSPVLKLFTCILWCLIYTANLLKEGPCSFLDFRLLILKNFVSHPDFMGYVPHVKQRSLRSQVHWYLCLVKYFFLRENSKLIELQKWRGNIHNEHKWTRSAFFCHTCWRVGYFSLYNHIISLHIGETEIWKNCVAVAAITTAMLLIIDFAYSNTKSKTSAHDSTCISKWHCKLQFGSCFSGDHRIPNHRIIES